MSESGQQNAGPQDARPQPTVGGAAKDLGVALGRAAGRTAGRAARGTRARIRRNPTADRVYRTGVGVVGTGTVALGVAMIPLPGPGALVALGGLGILSTEFEGAKRVRVKAQGVARSAAAKAGELRDQRRARRAG
jgi:uncharacterized protein (TIGR02611 family)